MDGDLATADASTERTLALQPRKSAPQRARDFVAETLSRWRLDHWVEQATLITSELVTNAVRHAGTELTVRVRRARSAITIEVADGAADKEPRTGPADGRAGGGVGLMIVGRLAQAWGVERRRDGKAVWARLAVGPSAGSGGSASASGSCSGLNSGRRLTVTDGGVARGG